MARAWMIVGIGTVVLLCPEPVSLRAAAADARPATTQATTRAAATRPANHDKLATEMIRWSDDVSAILATVTDEATAKAAVPRLDEAADRILALRDATERMGPAGPEGFFVIAGLSGFGIMAAAGAGELLAGHVTGAVLPEHAPAFLPRRYQDPSYLASPAGEAATGQL